MRSLFALTVLLASLAVGDPIATPIMVPAGGNLQDALNRAGPGETVMLERGATFVGNFVLPVHADGGVVTLRTAGDAGFPVEGDRMTPESAAALAKLR
jgi:hypothetical protein